LSFIKKLLGLGPKPVIAKSRYITIEEAKMAPFTKKSVGRGYGAIMRPDEYYIVGRWSWETPPPSASLLQLTSTPAEHIYWIRQ